MEGWPAHLLGGCIPNTDPPLEVQANHMHPRRLPTFHAPYMEIRPPSQWRTATSRGPTPIRVTIVAYDRDANVLFTALSIHLLCCLPAYALYTALIA